MTFQQALAHGTGLLKKAKISDAESSARFLLAAILEKNPVEVLLSSQDELSEPQQNKYQDYVQRRANHEPVAYIVGQQPFAGLTLTVTPDTLIPRSETEQLLQLIELTTSNQQPTTMIDIGTGSGAIAISLASQFPYSQIIATDISAQALQVARANDLEKKVIFIQANLLESLDGATIPANIDIIVANLPYVPSQRLAQLQPDVRDFEPQLALDGGQDGLDCYRRLFDQMTAQNIIPRYFFGEIDETHGQSIQKLIATHWPAAKSTIYKDLAGLDRFIVARLKV